MNLNLAYRGPAPSRATRTISQRGKASLRGALVAKLPAFDHPRVIQFESALEYRFLCLMLVRDDVQDVWEQPPAVIYIDRNGRNARHVYDFLVTLKDGTRFAVAVKPMQRVRKRGFDLELERIAAATPLQFADHVLLITDEQIDRAAAAQAARTLMFSRPVLTTEIAA